MDVFAQLDTDKYILDMNDKNLIPAKCLKQCSEDLRNGTQHTYVMVVAESLELEVRLQTCEGLLGLFQHFR
jgi:hypothetical protein